MAATDVTHLRSLVGPVAEIMLTGGVLTTRRADRADDAGAGQNLVSSGNGVPAPVSMSCFKLSRK
jgi:hypothetical protein